MPQYTISMTLWPDVTITIHRLIRMENINTLCCSRMLCICYDFMKLELDAVLIFIITIIIHKQKNPIILQNIIYALPYS